MAFNIMDIQNPKDMYTKLKSICGKFGYGIVYLIFQELFHYFWINEPKRYYKPVLQIFIKVKYLCKYLQMAITLNWDLCNIIAMVIAHDSLYNNFDTMTLSLLESKNKLIDKIQSILQFKEAKNISKYTIREIGKLGLVFKNNNSSKQKAFNYKNYFNCHKLKHFGKDCPYLNKRQTHLQKHNNIQL